MRNGSLFNPACDPTGAHTTGGQHPTAYCTAWTNGYIYAWDAQHPGWTNGYIYAWNAKHSIIPSIPNLVACKKEFSDTLVCTSYAYTNTSQRSTK